MNVSATVYAKNWRDSSIILCSTLIVLITSFQCLSQNPIYANSIIYESNVNNSSNSIDSNPSNFSELNANSGALLGVGSYTGVLEVAFPSIVPANQTCYVQIEMDDNVLEALMGGTLGNLLSGITGVALSGNQEFIVRAKNGASTVLEGNSTIPGDFTGELMKIVVNEFNETFLAITPQLPYQSIRITNGIGSLIGANTSKIMKVYDPYYVPNALECGRPTFTSYDANGITLDLLQLNAGATNIYRAIDANKNSFSELSLGVVTTPSWIEQKMYFEGLSNSNDIFGIRLRINPSMNLIDLGNAIVIRGQNGAQTESFSSLNGLLTIQDIDSLSNGDPTTVYFQPGTPVDRIGITFTSLLGVSLDQFLEVYEVFKIAPAPVYDVVGSNDTVCMGTSAMLFASASDSLLDIRWYFDSIGGAPIGITASGAPFVTPNIWNDTTFWVAAGKSGCPDETSRIPVSVWIIPTPLDTDISFNLIPSGYCASDSIVITPTSSVGTQFQWYLDSTATQAISDGIQSGSLTFGIDPNGELTVTGAELVNSPYTFWASVQDSMTLCSTAPGGLSEVTVNILDEPAPTTSNANQVFCAIQNATLADVQVNQPSINWYDGNGILLPPNTVLVDSTEYYATAVGAFCESSDSLTVLITIIDEASPTTMDSTQYFCPTDSATLNDLLVTGLNINWYDAATNGNLLPPSTPLVNGTTYYASQVGALCESSQLLAIDVVIDDLSAPTTQNVNQVFCEANSPTIDDIQTDQPNIVWYVQSSGGSPLPGGTPLVNGNTYYAALTNGNCESAIRLEVVVTFENVPPPTTTSSVQFFCDPGSAGPVLTVDDIDVNQPNIVWYDAANGGNVIPSGTPLVDGQTYYAALQGQFCESETRLMIYVDIESVPAPTTTNTQQNFCNSMSPMIADLQVNELNINWYNAAGDLLSDTTVLVDGMTYYASQVGVNCESSDQLMITVTVIDQTGAEIIGETQSICVNDTLQYTAPAGMMNYTWTVIGGTIISGGNSNVVTVTWNNSTTNSIEVSYETMNGCLITMTNSIPITLIACSDLTILKTVNNETPFVGDEVIFTITVSNNGSDIFNSIIVDESIPSGYTYISSTATSGTYNPTTGEWEITTLNGGQSVILEITVKVNPTGDYLNTAHITISDPLDANLNNNSSSASAEPNCLTVYNEITPNGDGVNDVLFIECIENYPNNSIAIFNRFGNQVYSVDSYQNNWDGVANVQGTMGKGEMLPTGTYYYVLKVGDEDFEAVGWIYIIR